MKTFLELHDCDGDPFLLDVEDISRACMPESGEDQQTLLEGLEFQTILCLRNGEEIACLESYKTVRSMLGHSVPKPESLVALIVKADSETRATLNYKIEEARKASKKSGYEAGDGSEEKP